jgi:hypothetical protein
MISGITFWTSLYGPPKWASYFSKQYIPNFPIDKNCTVGPPPTLYTDKSSEFCGLMK